MYTFNAMLVCGVLVVLGYFLCYATMKAHIKSLQNELDKVMDINCQLMSTGKAMVPGHFTPAEPEEEINPLEYSDMTGASN